MTKTPEYPLMDGLIPTEREKIIEIMARAAAKHESYLVEDPEGASRAQVDALNAAGYTIAPVEPTETIIDKMMDYAGNDDATTLEYRYVELYKAMIRAAQESADEWETEGGRIHKDYIQETEENASTRLYRDMKQIRCLGCGRETVLAKDLPDLCQSCREGP